MHHYCTHARGPANKHTHSQGVEPRDGGGVGGRGLPVCAVEPDQLEFNRDPTMQCGEITNNMGGWGLFGCQDSAIMGARSAFKSIVTQHSPLYTYGYSNMNTI